MRSYAEKCGMPYVNERWLGGMLTNFDTISKRVAKMLEYERMQASGEFDAMPKKEALLLDRELEKLQRNLGGLRGLTASARRDLRARHEEGAHRRHRGQQARHPGGRRGRHQRRPRARAVPDPGQRRRHPGQLAARPGHRRRRRGGPLHRLQARTRRSAPVTRTAEEEAEFNAQQAAARREAAAAQAARERRLETAQAAGADEDELTESSRSPPTPRRRPSPLSPTEAAGRPSPRIRGGEPARGSRGRHGVVTAPAGDAASVTPEAGEGSAGTDATRAQRPGLSRRRAGRERSEPASQPDASAASQE